MLNSLRKLPLLLAVVILVLLHVSAAGQLPGESWVRVGLLGGTVTALGVSPGYEPDTTLFAGLERAGLWRSTDRGATWSRMTSIPFDATVTAVAFDVNYGFGLGRPLYVAANVPAVSGKQSAVEGRLYTSIDDFATAQYMFVVKNRTNQDVPVTSLVSPTAGAYLQNVFAGSRGGGIFKSTNFGATWTRCNGLATQDDCRALAAGPSGQVLAAVQTPGPSQGGPVFQYLSLGSWGDRGPAALDNVTPTALHVASSQGTDAWLGTANRGLWFCKDITNATLPATWGAVCGPVALTVGYSVDAVAACPDYKSPPAPDYEVWEGRSEGLWQLTLPPAGPNGCNPTDLRAAITKIAFGPGYHVGGRCDAFEGTRDGLYRESCDLGQPAPNVEPRAIPVWSLALAPLNGTWAGAPMGLFRNGPGTDFLEYNAYGWNFSAPVAIKVTPGYDYWGACGTNAQTLFVADYWQGVWKSQDNGNSWAKLSLGWPAASNVVVNDLAISPVYGGAGGDQTLYAATNAGLYRWAGTTTGWVKASQGSLNVTHVAVPPTYDPSKAAVFPYHTVFFSSDDLLSGGVYLSTSDGGAETRFSAFSRKDVTALTFSPRYGLPAADNYAFAATATGGAYFTGRFSPASPTPSDGWCAINAGTGAPLPLEVRDLEASPVLSGANISLLAATVTGPYNAFFQRGGDSNNCPSANYGWNPSLFTTPPSGCRDTYRVTYAYLGDGTVAALGTAEDGVFFSGTSGQAFDVPGTGYHTLPPDVWAVFPYMRNSYNGTEFLFATSPEYGAFIYDGSWQVYNGSAATAPASCSALNWGAFGFAGGLQRDSLSGPNFDQLYSGTDCAGIWYRNVYYNDATGVYDFNAYAWNPTNVTTGTFQQLRTINNGAASTPIWASSADRGTCTGAGEWACPDNVVATFSNLTAGLPNGNATAVEFGQTYSRQPAGLSSGVPASGSVALGQWADFAIVVPDGQPHLQVTLSGLTADLDLYVRFAALPTTALWDFRPGLAGTSPETVDVYPDTSQNNPPGAAALAGGVWYVSVFGVSAGTNPFTITASLLAAVAPAGVRAQDAAHGGGPAAGAASSPSASQALPSPAAGSRPGPLAPAAGTVWGTVSNSGVYKGEGVATLSGGPSPMVVTWTPRNGAGWGGLDLSRPTQAVIQLSDGTLLAGQQGALWQSPAPDEGRATWVNLSSSLGGTSLNVRSFLESCNGDLLAGISGTAGAGGVWLSGSGGRYWMNISTGFDPASENLQSLVKTDCAAPPVQYYGSTGTTGLYTRTVTAMPYPTVTGISVSSGPATGGTAVTVTGTGFSNSCPSGNPTDCPLSAPVVLFGNAAVPATFVSSTQLTAVTPVHGTGTFAVSVVNPDSRQGTCSCVFTFTGDSGLTLYVTRVAGKNRLNWGANTTVTIQRALNPRFTMGLTQTSCSASAWTDNSSAGTDGSLYFYRVQ